MNDRNNRRSSSAPDAGASPSGSRRAGGRAAAPGRAGDAAKPAPDRENRNGPKEPDDNPPPIPIPGGVCPPPDPEGR